MRPLTLALALSLCLVAARAAAGDDPVRADALFREAQTRVAAGDLARACAIFAESARLEPAPGTWLNWGDCEERRGRLATAHQLFVRAKEALPPGVERAAYAERRAAILSARVPRVTLRLAAGAPESTQVTSDGTVLSRASFDVPLPIDPGPHDYVVTAEGHEPTTISFRVVPSESLTLDLAPGPRVTARPRAPAEARAATATPSRPAVFVAGGIGLAGVATGIITGLLVLDHAATYRDHCTPSCDDEGARAARLGRPVAIVSPIAFAVGLVGASVATYLLVRSGASGATAKPSPSRGQSALVELAPGPWMRW